MADHQGRNNLPAQPWLALDVVVVPGLLHNLPKHTEKVLPLFNPNEKPSTDDHIK